VIKEAKAEAVTEYATAGVETLEVA
jgi:hypothetical protein